MRHTEILRARYDQIDFDKLRLFIPDAKAGEREQPITPQLASILSKEREMRDEDNRDGWVFLSPRQNSSRTGHRAIGWINRSAELLSGLG
jgi:integrase